MDIKTMMIRTAKRLKRLALAMCGVEALLPSPAAAKRGKTATIASLRVANADAPTIDGSNAVAASPQDVAASQQALSAVRRRRKRTRIEVEIIPLEKKRRWLTIREASARFPCFSEKSLRHLMAQAEAYANYPKAGLRSNGLIGCIARPAGLRKVLIDAEKFEQWIAAGTAASSDQKPARSSLKAVREAP